MAATIATALRRLAAILGPLSVARLYRSRALSPIPQPDFLNTAAVGRTALPPDAVLALAKRLEFAAGRRQGPRFAPRPLDVDLLLYGSWVLGAPELTLPHPRLADRRFVLTPLADVARNRRVPPGGATVAELLAALPPGGDDWVEPVPWPPAARSRRYELAGPGAGGGSGPT